MYILSHAKGGTANGARGPVNFNIIEETNDGRVLFEIKIHHDYGYILDWLRSNEVLQEKIKEVLEQAEKSDETQTLAFNIPA